MGRSVVSVVRMFRCSIAAFSPIAGTTPASVGYLCISNRTCRASGKRPAVRSSSPNKKGSASMGLFTKDIKTMNDLFVHQLQDIYYAEKQLVKALPKMADKATDKQLKQGFLTHLDETKIHVQRLEQVFQMHGAEVKAVNCPAIDGIIKDCLLYTS